MEWADTGVVLSVRPHGETSAIIELLTREHGRHAGLVRGGVSRRLRGVLQPGNVVRAEWRARLEDHLGAYTVELDDARAAPLMDDPLALSGLASACAVALKTLPEREAHPAVFEAFLVLLQAFENTDVWPALYVKWEACLLADLGYGLDLVRCAATGERENLTHVSPRSGRAVSATAAEPYRDKLLVLPRFLIDPRAAAGPSSITAGLALTGHFLERRIFWLSDKGLPLARGRMLERLRAADGG